MCVRGKMDIRKYHKQMLYDNEISKQKNDHFCHKRQQQSKVILPKKKDVKNIERVVLGKCMRLMISYAQLLRYYKCYIRSDGNVWATLPESLICLTCIILCAHLSL